MFRYASLVFLLGMYLKFISLGFYAILNAETETKWHQYFSTRVFSCYNPTTPREREREREREKERERSSETVRETQTSLTSKRSFCHMETQW